MQCNTSFHGCIFCGQFSLSFATAAAHWLAHSTCACSGSFASADVSSSNGDVNTAPSSISSILVIAGTNPSLVSMFSADRKTEKSMYICSFSIVVLRARSFKRKGTELWIDVCEKSEQENQLRDKPTTTMKMYTYLLFADGLHYFRPAKSVLPSNLPD